jgi:hypothetical protein
VIRTPCMNLDVMASLLLLLLLAHTLSKELLML